MTVPLNTVIQGDCREVLLDVPEGSVDLVVMDPPYAFSSVRGGGSFGSDARRYHSELEGISHGVDGATLELIVSRLKAVNIYVWCNKAQLCQYLDYFEGRGCSCDILAWHKTNPTPSCGNKYLSDTEYIVYARDPGVRLYGTYETKRKWYATPVNRADKALWGHPTIKPLAIVRNLILNSMPPGGGRDCP